MSARIVDLRKGVLEKNDLLAQSLRAQFTEASTRVSNWVSSPGSGKTALLETLLTAALGQSIRAAALVGDCALPSARSSPRACAISRPT
jgi:hydrogenase nickel incorporation protein HypB